MQISMDDRDVKRFARDLRAMRERAYPFATRATLNSAAFDAQNNYRRNASQRLTLRNNWTRQSIQVDKARTLRVSRQAATVGIVAPYLEKQEFAGTERGEGKSQPLATNESANIARNVRPRERLPTKRNLRRNVSLLRTRKGANQNSVTQ